MRGYIDSPTGPVIVYGHDTEGLAMTSLVIIGDTIAAVWDWAQALGLQRATVASRLRSGDSALRALRPMGTKSHWDALPWEDDIPCRRFVARLGVPATLEQVGEHLGLTRERVRQIEAAALRKLRVALDGHVDGRELLYAMQQRTSPWEHIIPEGSKRAQTDTVINRVEAVLSESGEWMSTVEVASIVGASRAAVSGALNTLARRRIAHRRERGKRIDYRIP